MTDWAAIAERNAKPQNTFIGWIFWDPGAEERYAALGLKRGGYIAARAAPLAPAGADAVVAAFYSISPWAIRTVHGRVTELGCGWDAIRLARDEAVVEGLHTYAPECVDSVSAIGPWLWEAVAACPLEGKVMFGAYKSLPTPDDPLLSAWYAINCLREHRGDTHWALYAAEGLSGVEASILHNAWVGYEADWLPKSRGSSEEEIATAWAALEQRGVARDREVNHDGLELRERIEQRTNELCVAPWRAIGQDRAQQFLDVVGPPCRALGKRVDVTAGTNYGPGGRVHAKGYGSARGR